MEPKELSRRANLLIAGSLLRKALGLPDDVEIIAADADRVDTLTLTIVHESLPALLPGCVLPNVSATVSSDEDGTLRFMGFES